MITKKLFVETITCLEEFLVQYFKFKMVQTWEPCNSSDSWFLFWPPSSSLSLPLGHKSISAITETRGWGDMLSLDFRRATSRQAEKLEKKAEEVQGSQVCTMLKLINMNFLQTCESFIKQFLGNHSITLLLVLVKWQVIIKSKTRSNRYGE